MNKLAILLIITLFPTMVLASNASKGHLHTMHFMKNGIVLVYTTGTRSNVPTCASAQPNRFAINATTPAGKVQLSGLLSAYNSGKEIVIYGTGNCSDYADSETINYFHTSD